MHDLPFEKAEWTKEKKKEKKRKKQRSDWPYENVIGRRPIGEPANPQTIFLPSFLPSSAHRRSGFSWYTVVGEIILIIAIIILETETARPIASAQLNTD